MTRKEIANEAFKILSKDFAGEYKDKVLWKVIAETSDLELLTFVEQNIKKIDKKY